VEARLDLLARPVAVRFGKHLVAAGKVLEDSTLPAVTREPVKLRAGRINGCDFCTDMRTKDALHAGESATRLHLVAARREATVFTKAERVIVRQPAGDHRPGRFA